jgi:hypothetical protein
MYRDPIYLGVSVLVFIILLVVVLRLLNAI